MSSRTYPAEIVLERRQYQELCHGLRNRGFQERAGGAEEKVRMGAGAVSLFSKSFSGFDIVYRAREDFGAHIREITERRMAPSFSWKVLSTMKAWRGLSNAVVRERIRRTFAGTLVI